MPLLHNIKCIFPLTSSMVTLEQFWAMQWIPDNINPEQFLICLVYDSD